MQNSQCCSGKLEISNGDEELPAEQSPPSYAQQIQQLDDDLIELTDEPILLKRTNNPNEILNIKYLSNSATEQEDNDSTTTEETDLAPKVTYIKPTEDGYYTFSHEIATTDLEFENLIDLVDYSFSHITNIHHFEIHDYLKRKHQSCETLIKQIIRNESNQTIFESNLLPTISKITSGILESADLKAAFAMTAAPKGEPIPDVLDMANELFGHEEETDEESPSNNVIEQEATINIVHTFEPDKSDPADEANEPEDPVADDTILYNPHNVIHIKKERLYIPLCAAQNTIITAQLDSAADKSCLAERDFNKIPKESYETLESDCMLKDVQGALIPQPHPPIMLKLQMGSYTVSVKFYVLKITQTLLGSDFILGHRFSMFYPPNEERLVFTLGDKVDIDPGNNIKQIISGPSITILEPDATLYNRKRQFLKPGRNEVEFLLDMPDNEYSTITGEGCPFRVSRITVSQGVVKAVVDNKTSEPIAIEPEQKIADIYDDDIDPTTKELTETEANQLSLVEPLGLPTQDTQHDWKAHVMKQEHIPQSMRETFINIIETELQDVISRHDLDVGKLKGRYSKIIHNIDTGNNTPVRVAPYKLDPVRTHQLEIIIKRLVKYGFLRKEDSAWAMGCFLISKRSETFNSLVRLIMDGRNLNKRTKASLYPFREPSTLFEAIGLAKPTIYSLVDISNAFWHIEMSEDAAEKSAIIVPGGVYKVLKLPFGLVNAPSSFNLLMSMVAEEFPTRPLEDGSGTRAVCVHYADDLLVMSRNETEHIVDLINVLRVLNNAGLKVALHKLKLFQTEVDFIGRRVDHLGIRPLPRHLTAVKNFPRPTTARNIMQWLGLLQWMSNTIPNFSAKISPFLVLLKKGVKFFWNDELERHFQHTKEDILKASKVYFIDYQAPIYIASDASKSHHGYVCYQIRSFARDDIDQFRESLYFSEQFTKKGVPAYHPILPPTTKNTAPLRYMSPVEQTEEFLNLDKAIEQRDKIKVRDSILERGGPYQPLETFLSEEDKLHYVLPVAFSSHTFPTTAKAWQILEKEAFAVVFSLKDLSPLLQSVKGGAFVLTDSQSLTWLLQTTTLARTQATKLQRWAISISELHFSILITHIPGSINPADALSRPYSIVWKVIEDEETSKLKPVTIISPFPVGAILTLDELDAYIKSRLENGELLVGSRQSGPNKYVTKPETGVVGSITTDAIDELLALLSDDNIAQEQAKDSEVMNAIGKPGFYQYLAIVNKRREHNQNADDNKGRIYLPTKLIGPCVALYHFKNHIGYKALSDHIAVTYYFVRLRQKVASFTMSCHLCAINRANFHAKTAISVESFKPAPKLSVWSMDFYEGYENAEKINSILVMIELGTNFKLIEGMKQPSAKNVAKALEEKIFANFMPPSVITSDQGANLLKSNEVMKKLHQYKVHAHTSVAYSPTSHGSVERANRSLGEVLRNLLRQYSEIPFSEMLRYAQHILNVTPAVSMGGYSPSYVMFGVNFTHFNQHNRKEDEYVRWTSSEANWEKQQLKIANAVIPYQNKQLRDKMNKGGKYIDLPEGSAVYLKDYRQHTKPKMKGRYLPSPLLVIHELDNTVIVRDWSGNTKTVRKSQCKRFEPRAKELFDSLPITVKVHLGEAFSLEDLQQYMEENDIPDFYKVDEVVYDGPAKRTRGQKLKLKERLSRQGTTVLDLPKQSKQPRKPKKSGTSGPSEDDTDDDDDDEDDGEMPDMVSNMPKKVRFEDVSFSS